MSINPFKKLEKQIKRALNHLGDDIKRGINSLGDQIKKQLSQTGDHIRRGLESVGKQLKGEIEDVAHKAKGELEHVGEEAKGELQHLANEARGEIEEVAKKAKGELEEVAEDARDLVEAALQELAKAVTREGLKKLRGAVKTAAGKMEDLARDKPRLVESIDACGFELNLGPLTLEYDGFYSRSEELLDALDRFVGQPPAFRRKPVLELVEALGPTTLDFGASIEFALVVGSQELGVGGKLKSVPLALGTEIADLVLKELGVPE